jgi:hypothetical protein
MFTKILGAVAAIAMVATSAPLADIKPTSTNYGSYVVICDSSSSNVTFVNFPDQECKGAATTYVMPLNQCKREFLFFSWNAQCNATNMWYSNYHDDHCGGNSVLTRPYDTFACRNCPNKECKTGPPPYG